MSVRIALYRILPAPCLIPYSPCTAITSPSPTAPACLPARAIFTCTRYFARPPPAPPPRGPCSPHRAARRAQYPLPRTRAATHCASCVSPRRVVVSLCCRCVVLCGAVWCCCLAVLQRVYPNTGLYIYRVAVITDLCVFVLLLFCFALVHLHIPTRVHRSYPSQCPT